LVTINLQDISIDKIKVSNENVRTLEVYNGLQDLADSIKSVGLQQPVVVFPITGKEGEYELIVGQRRFLAYRTILKEKTIPAIVLKKPLNSVDALAYSFAENIHRQEIAPRDKVTVTTKLLKELGDVAAVAKKLHVSQTTIRNYLGWAAVPEPIKQLVENKKLSKKNAVRISKTNNNVARAVAIATKVTEAPRREDRNAIVQTSIDHPEYDPEKVFSEAPKLKYKQITLDLTDAVSEALERASKKYDLEPQDLASQVLTDYLREEGFYK
jgi:ParB/RepB/Spo0J family partition protein